jgi:hypothetical protein
MAPAPPTHHPTQQELRRMKDREKEEEKMLTSDFAEAALCDSAARVKGGGGAPWESSAVRFRWRQRRMTAFALFSITV